LDDFNEAIKIDPNNSLAYLDRGNVYYDTDQFDKALDDYNKALELDPDCAMAYYDLGNLRAHYLHQYERSIVDFDKAIALDNTYADAYNSRGVSYFYLADYDKAMENYSKAIELDPSAAVFYRNRGIIYLHRMQTAEALSDFNKAIDLDPNEIESHGGRALVFMIRKDYCSALEESKITGILSVKAGRIDDAIGAFSQGFSLNGVFSNDDTIYCGIFRLVLDPSDYFYLELRNLINRQGMQNEALGAIWTLVLKKLKNENVNSSEIKKMTLQEDLHLLAKYVADM
jgi:tetratricopeptide (TPR) repeat protein